jgi:aminoglycoside 3-N-acetyltransferase
MNRPEISRTQVVQQLRDLGVAPGAVLVVNTSFRAVRPVEGGPGGLIAALRQVIGAGGTLVMPTMTGSSRDEAYDAATTPTHDGVVAETFWRLPGVLRSDHPTSSFAAAGPLAASITAPQPLEPVHGLDSPIGRVYQHDGQILLLGVDHSTDTTVHLGEDLAHVPYRIAKWANVREGENVTPVTFHETDHCCRHFQRVDGWLRELGLQREGRVGSAHARLARSRDVVSLAVEQLAANPTCYLCPRGAACDECASAWQSIAR